MRSNNLAQTTFVMGYWRVPGNTKHDPSFYFNRIPASIEMVAGGKLIVLTDDDEFQATVRREAEKHRVDLMITLQKLTDLPAREQATQIVSHCASLDLESFRTTHSPRGFIHYEGKNRREKGVIHYEREYLKSGPEIYRQILSAWLSKTSLMAEKAITENPYETERFAWLDASVSRFKEKRGNWDFTSVDLSASALHHYGSRMRYRGECLPLNASFLCASVGVWQRVHELFWSQLGNLVHDGYPHDEETVLGIVHQKHPELFRCIGMPTGNPRKKPPKGDR